MEFKVPTKIKEAVHAVIVNLKMYCKWQEQIWHVCIIYYLLCKNGGTRKYRHVCGSIKRYLRILTSLDASTWPSLLNIEISGYYQLKINKTCWSKRNLHQSQLLILIRLSSLHFFFSFLTSPLYLSLFFPLPSFALSFLLHHSISLYLSAFLSMFIAGWVWGITRDMGNSSTALMLRSWLLAAPLSPRIPLLQKCGYWNLCSLDFSQVIAVSLAPPLSIVSFDTSHWPAELSPIIASPLWILFHLF